MEIFVRSYQDGDGDGVGDLRGLIAPGLPQGPGRERPVADAGDRQPGPRPRLRGAGYRAIEAATAAWPTSTSCCARPCARHRGRRRLRDEPQRGRQRDLRELEVLEHRHLPRLVPLVGHSPRAGRSTATTLARQPGNCYFAPFWDRMPDWNLLNPGVVATTTTTCASGSAAVSTASASSAVGNLVENGPSAWENQPQNYALMRDVRSLLDGYARRFLVCEGPSDPSATPRPAAARSRSTTTGREQPHRRRQGATPRQRSAWPTSRRRRRPACRPCCPTDSFARPATITTSSSATWRSTGWPPPPTCCSWHALLYGGESARLSAATLTGDAKLRTPMSWTTTRGFLFDSRPAPPRPAEPRSAWPPNERPELAAGVHLERCWRCAATCGSRAAATNAAASGA